MEKSDFDKLLDRYVTNETTPEETAKLNAWLDVAKTQNIDGDELSEQEQEQLFKKITSNLGLEEFKTSLPRKSQVNWTNGIAATVLLLLSVSAFLWFSRDTSNIEKIILNDGTIVWLKGGGSKLIYYEKPNDPNRYAQLTGEGLFEVTKDSSRPFLISCGDMSVRVLGTSFNLKFVNDSIFLNVLTGKVNVSSMKDSIGVDVSKNEGLIYSNSSTVESESLNSQEIVDFTSSTEYDMQFSKVSIADVFTRIERKFDVVIKRDKTFGDCPVNGDFTDHSLDSTLNMLSEIIEFTYVIEGKTVTISGNGCR